MEQDSKKIVSPVNWIFDKIPKSIDEKVALELLDAALQVRNNAYAPYSLFEVGSAIMTEDGSIYTGANVENASYGGTMCAERVAIFNAVKSGNRAITAIAVVADYPEPLPPCGICRQVIAEFAREADVIMANTTGSVRIENMKYLFPDAFNLEKRKD